MPMNVIATRDAKAIESRTPISQGARSRERIPHTVLEFECSCKNSQGEPYRHGISLRENTESGGQRNAHGYTGIVESGEREEVGSKAV